MSQTVLNAIGGIFRRRWIRRRRGRTRNLQFYATRGDLLPMLAEFEAAQSVHYAAMFSNEGVREFVRAADIPDLGRPSWPELPLSPGYLIAHKDARFRARTLSPGCDERYAVQEDRNPHAIELSPGGEYARGVLLEGRIATLSGRSQREALLNSLVAVVRRRWIRVGRCYVGPEAATILDGGGRLTFNVRAPREYDLRRPGGSWLRPGGGLPEG